MGGWEKGWGRRRIHLHRPQHIGLVGGTRQAVITGTLRDALEGHFVSSTVSTPLS